LKLKFISIRKTKAEEEKVKTHTSAALKKSGYPQVPGSIPAENTQIHMDSSKETLKQGF